MTRPLIGVTTSHRHGWVSWQFQRLSIWRAGGIARRLTAPRVSDAAAVADELDGLVIGGGDDIAATLYGGTVEPAIRVDPERDALELSLLRALAGGEKPVLGVCRGSQMLSVWRGGSLIGDIYRRFPGLKRQRTVLPLKRVGIAEDSRLAAIIGRTRLRVNSLHHQAVDDPGEGMRIAARDRRGVAQAVESLGDRFLVGVQWHPEYMPQKRTQRRLYRSLVEAAKVRRD